MAYNLIIETQMTGVIMATKIIMKNGEGKLKEGFIGWSWTVFFFGSIPALFRLDLAGFIAMFFSMLMANLLVMGLSTSPSDEIYGTLFVCGGLRVLWCSVYNGWHLERLKARGFAMVNGGM